VNSAEHRIAIASKTVTGQCGSYTVLQQVNVQSDHQCKFTDSWGRVVPRLGWCYGMWKYHCLQSLRAF